MKWRNGAKIGSDAWPTLLNYVERRARTFERSRSGNEFNLRLVPTSSLQENGSPFHTGTRPLSGLWHLWTRRLTERDKYEITSWAFSYFMRSNLTIPDAVIEAVKKARPDKVDKDGHPNVSRHDLVELEQRVKNML